MVRFSFSSDHGMLIRQLLGLRFVSFLTSPSLSPPGSHLQGLCSVISRGVGSFDELESTLDKSKDCLTPSSVVQIIESCKKEAPTRRLLRFFSWSLKTLRFRMDDEDFNHVIRIFTEKKDFLTLDILISCMLSDGRVMEKQTFSIVAETLVKLGKEDVALGIFKNLDSFRCTSDTVTVVSMINALCSKGHARKAETVLRHHRNKVSGSMACIYRNLLLGWTVNRDVKQARRVLQAMESDGVLPCRFCYNTFMKCTCQHNLKFNPYRLVLDAMDIMLEMKTKGLDPDVLSYNILLSCLGRSRRVRAACRVLDSMNANGCAPNWVSYFLVIRVLFLAGRFGKGKEVIETLFASGLRPEPKFYYDLVGVLCGVERVNHGIWLFEHMKKYVVCDYGPVYDVLIEKTCRRGDFEKGKELWDEAISVGATLTCSSDLIDPSLTEVFKYPSRDRRPAK